MADEAPDGRAKRLDRLTELIAVFILSVAALMSAYASFQAELWDGEQAANYALAEQARTAASMNATATGQSQGLDVLLFSQWLNAAARDDVRLETFYRKRFRPAFRDAFEAWMATDPLANPAAPRSPFETASYVKSIDPRPKLLQAKADEFFAKGQQANDISDVYVQATLILALTLFLGGVVQAFNVLPLRITLLGIAGLSCLIGIVRVLTLPALRITF